jgi:hypothetical protein
MRIGHRWTSTHTFPIELRLPPGPKVMAVGEDENPVDLRGCQFSMLTACVWITSACLASGRREGSVRNVTRGMLSCRRGVCVSFEWGLAERRAQPLTGRRTRSAILCSAIRRTTPEVWLMCNGSSGSVAAGMTRPSQVSAARISLTFGRRLRSSSSAPCLRGLAVGAAWFSRPIYPTPK